MVLPANKVLLNKTYSGEELSDVDRDVSEAFDGDLTPDANDIPVDEHGFATGVFSVRITWSPE